MANDDPYSPLRPAAQAVSDTGAILVLNAGSSSLKFALFGASAALPTLLRGEVSELDSVPHLVALVGDGEPTAEQHWSGAGEETFTQVLAAVVTLVDATPGHGGLQAVGHRIVNGGPDHVAPERITPTVMAALRALAPLDPLHLPHSLAPIAALDHARPGLCQIACFDTAFHHTMPPRARTFALPRAITAAGVRRYGFHGLSYEYIAGRLAREWPELARGRVIVAHLGAGASLCALAGGVSVDTTFGFSVLDGLMMATRCGSLDPGVIFHLARQGQSLGDIEDMLYHRSGLLGVSGVSGDVRALLASQAPEAREALDLYAYRLAGAIGAMTSALGGLDGLVFTAGVGQHAPAIRAAVCSRLGWLGVTLDPLANEANAACISASASGIAVLVMATDEEAMIARHVLALIGETGPAG